MSDDGSRPTPVGQAELHMLSGPCFQGPECLTTGHGQPLADKLNSVTVGPRGPLLIEDRAFIDEMAHFDRERIPERVVHAKGAGAFGYFEASCTAMLTTFLSNFYPYYPIPLSSLLCAPLPLSLPPPSTFP